MVSRQPSEDSVPLPLIFLIYFYYLVCEAIGTAATPALLCQPRLIVKMIVEKQMECRLAGETEVLGENLSQRHFCPSQNPTWPDPGLNPGHRGGKPATNRLSYGAAYCPFLTSLRARACSTFIRFPSFYLSSFISKGKSLEFSEDFVFVVFSNFNC
jgi:hypothetical protein